MNWSVSSSAGSQARMALSKEEGRLETVMGDKARHLGLHATGYQDVNTEAVRRCMAKIQALQETQERVNDLTAMVQAWWTLEPRTGLPQAALAEELQDSHKALVEELRCKVRKPAVGRDCHKLSALKAVFRPKRLQPSTSTTAAAGEGQCFLLRTELDCIFFWCCSTRRLQG